MVESSQAPHELISMAETLKVAEFAQAPHELSSMAETLKVAELYLDLPWLSLVELKDNNPTFVSKSQLPCAHCLEPYLKESYLSYFSLVRLCLFDLVTTLQCLCNRTNLRYVTESHHSYLLVGC